VIKIIKGCLYNNYKCIMLNGKKVLDKFEFLRIYYRKIIVRGEEK
jgi:hypothetical protein